MTGDRLQQVLEYAQALEMAAQYGIGNKQDTADIVAALQELQAYRTLWMNICAQQRRAA